MIERLGKFLAHYRDTQFETGKHDCALFVAHWIELRTGEDLAASFKGAYRSDRESHKLIRAKGYQHLEDMVLTLGDKVGVRRETPLLAQRGDVAWITDGDTKLCGIVCAAGVAVLSDQGLIIKPLHSINVAWCIPEGGA